MFSHFEWCRRWFLELETPLENLHHSEGFSNHQMHQVTGKKEFAAVALDPKHETFVVYFASLSSIMLLCSTPLDINIHLFSRPQIANLMVKEVFIKDFVKYADFADVFFLDLASKLPKHTRINNYAIKLANSQQPPYEPIYSLKPVELKTLTAYIKIKLANKFIRLSKLSASAPIFFDRKSDKSFWLYINYKSLNNLITKNRYPLLLIGELLDRLKRARRLI